MKKVLLIIGVITSLIGCKNQHVYSTRYGTVDIDTVQTIMYDSQRNKCYKVWEQDKDSIEKAPGEWGYIDGPIIYYYCPSTGKYYCQFPTNDEYGNSVVEK